MKNLLLSLFFLLSFSALSGQQENSFFFNVLSPSSIYASYGSDEIGYTVDWGPTVEESIVGELAYAPDGTGELLNVFCTASDEDFSGKFVLIERGECFFADKVHWAEQSGAVGVIIISFDGGVVPMAGGGDYFELVNIPAIIIPIELGEQLKETLFSGTEVFVEFSPNEAPMAHTTGNVGIDANGDCLSGDDEINLAGWKVNLTNDEVYKVGFTDSDGNYDISSNIGNYTVSVEPPNDIWDVCENEVPVVHTDFSNQEVDFAAAATEDCAQMSVNMIAPFWRRCFENQLVISYCNIGSIAAEDTYLTLELPSVIQILLTNTPYTVNDEGLYVFNVGNDIGNMGVGQCGTINLLTEVSCDADLGEILCAESYVYHSSTACTDATPNLTGNSSDLLCLEVIGAYDPNDKNANPRGYGEEHFIDQNTSIEYFIRFQNTGTDTAFNVVVLDTLSASFDVSSLLLGASSHDYDLRIIENHILEFTFADIQLVDSFANEPASHGFFSYEIKQNVDVELGTIIENSAAIYFDFNEPVITNTTFHEVGRDFINPTIIHCPVAPNDEATFAPLPMATETIVVIHTPVDIKTGHLEVFDVNGKMMLTQKFDSPQFTIKTDGLPNGAYFYRYYLNGDFVGSGKVVK